MTCEVPNTLVERLKGIVSVKIAALRPPNMMISVANLGASGRNTAPRPIGSYGYVQPRIGVSIKSTGSSMKRATVVRAESPDTEGGVLKFINSLSSAITNSPFNQFKIKLAELQAGSYDADATKAKVEEYIANNKVMVFSWSACPFCTKAKSVLDDMGVQYTALELDTMGEEGAAYRAELAKKTSRTSMPNIFIEGKGIGGCNDGPGLLTLKNNGELEPMLRAAEAM